MARDRLFMWVIGLFLGFIALYSIGLIVMLIVQPSETITLRFISSIGVLFSGLLGLASGYLMGTSRDPNGNGNAKQQ